MEVVKELTTYEKVPFPLLQRKGAIGVLQGHLAKLLHLNTYSLSLLIKQMGIDKAILSSKEAKFLKGLGVIHPQTRGGNFLTLGDLIKILDSVDSEESRNLRGQLEGLQ
ncbi:MAG: hypothetical protein EOP04_21210 [Proteobacteria bacterium]|nr:MAG: hypothetical protein EOP04_21210 [Pseudomonadota bacterium]